MAHSGSSGRGFPIRPRIDLAPTRRSLLSRLKRWDDHDAWQQFFDTYWLLIYSAAINAGLTDAEAEDVLQETVIAVSKHMPTFHYAEKDGSFKSWLLRLTSWRIVDQFRLRGATVNRSGTDSPSGTQTAITQPALDPGGSEFEAMWDTEFENSLMKAALERVKGKVDPAKVQIFDLHVLQRWPVPKIVQFVKRNRAYIYLSSHKVGRLVAKEIAKLKSKSL